MVLLKVRKALPVLVRKHKKCHVKRFSKPQNEKKDIAAPKLVTTLDPTLHLPTPKSLARARKRASRVKEGTALTFEALPLNKTMRAACMWPKADVRMAYARNCGKKKLSKASLDLFVS